MSMKTIHTDLPARPAHVALADHFADPGASQRPLRIRLTSGEEFDCHAPVFDIDHLVLIVTTSEGVTRKVRPADIETLYERRPRWPAYEIGRASCRERGEMSGGGGGLSEKE